MLATLKRSIRSWRCVRGRPPEERALGEWLAMPGLIRAWLPKPTVTSPASPDRPRLYHRRRITCLPREIRRRISPRQGALRHQVKLSYIMQCAQGILVTRMPVARLTPSKSLPHESVVLRGHAYRRDLVRART